MYTVAIIDDEILICEGLKRIIDWKSLECSVWTFTRGQDFLDIAEQLNPNIVITDIKMPFLSGLDLIAIAQQSIPHAQFIILSGYTDFEYAQRGINLGVLSYLLKPVNPKELQSIVEKCLQLIAREEEIRSSLEKWTRNRNIQTILSDKTLLELKRNINHSNHETSRQLMNDIFALLTAIENISMEELRQQCIYILFYVIENISDYALKMNPSLGVNILSISNSTHYNTPEQLKNWANSIISSVIDIKKELALTMQNTSLYSRIINYVDEHFSDDLSLEELSQMFFTNPSYISQLFKKNTSSTFLAYVTNKRIEKAKYLLTTTNHKVYEICYLCGYSDLKYFGKLFQKMTGFTPNEYRNQENHAPK